VAQRGPPPYGKGNARDAERLGWAENREVTVVVGEATLHLPVRRSPHLPPGVAALPAGLPGLPGLPLPAWGQMHAAPADGPAAPRAPEASP